MAYPKGYQKYEIPKEELVKLYNNEKKSIRRIARELNIPKTTIEAYFDKFSIKRRIFKQVCLENKYELVGNASRSSGWYSKLISH